MAKVLIEESTLSAIGDAIREKEGSTALVPVTEMATRICDIPVGGGGLDNEDLVITGDCQYRFSYNGWNSFINKYGNRITTYGINNATNMFYYSNQLVSIPFELNINGDANFAFYNCSKLQYVKKINCESTYTSRDFGSFFNSCTSFQEVPYVYNASPSSVRSFFSGCTSVRYIPDDYFDTWDFSYKSIQASYLFKNCVSLRKIPTGLFEKFVDSTVTGNSCIYYDFASYCYSLDEIIGMNVFSCNLNSNGVSGMLSSCSRLSRFTFKTNNDGTPLIANWKSQTLDFTSYVGYAQSVPYILNYNSGITADKQVIDDATYQALKNDPDWFTADIAYSRYNHDSAVETINSLPDTSAYLAANGGTNIIKFKGASGSATDGGAINTLTEEEIAVATAKGWTVTLS